MLPKKHNDELKKNYQSIGETTKEKRYWTPELIKWIKELDELNLRMSDIRANLLKRQLANFDKHYQTWFEVISFVSQLDCLQSLAQSSHANGVTCRPKFVQKEKAYFEAKQMRHPTIANRVSEFIPNDISLGDTDSPHVMILTGPNMGGKSTLLRQVCITIIMAQIGCFVHAEECTLSPIDRIFTRIGANDEILYGRSTFMVELLETSNILKNSTKNSLVILDELGRGTSTHDGYSIAYGVLKFLIKQNCLVFFSTHYHKLTEEFVNEPLVQMNHMDCILEDDRVIFLYSLVPGTSNSSFGMNVALMSQISNSIVQRATQVSKEFEERTNRLQGRNLELEKKLFETVKSSSTLEIEFLTETWNKLKIKK